MTAQLVVRGVSMYFAGQRALDDIDLTLRRGEIHALLGANGSGKSTFIKILAGYHAPEQGGEVTIGGHALAFGSARASHAAGLRFIHQDLGLVETLDVAENLRLGSSYGQTWWLSGRRQHSQAAAMLRKYGLDVAPSSPLAELSAAQKSMVAIIRAVEDGLGDDGVLVLDEPTAALPQEEVEHVLRLLRELKARGVTILYVTHRLPEVFAIADRATVFRDGRRIATDDVTALTHDSLIELMLGKRLGRVPQAAHRSGTKPLLLAERVTGENVVDLSFEAYRGEILGITGLLGSGYESVLGLVYGSSKRSSGDVRLCGRPVPSGSPRRAMAAGICYAPADRRGLGSFISWSVRENLTIPRLTADRLTGRVSSRAEAEEARQWISRLDVRPGWAEAKFSELSGGNQQKVVIGRMLRCRPTVLLLDEPTAGVDAGAKSAVYAELRAAAAEGAVVVVSSSDTEELAELCDRVLVLSGGATSRELVGKHTSAEITRATLAAHLSTAGSEVSR